MCHSIDAYAPRFFFVAHGPRRYAGHPMGFGPRRCTLIYCLSARSEDTNFVPRARLLAARRLKRKRRVGQLVGGQGRPVKRASLRREEEK